MSLSDKKLSKIQAVLGPDKLRDLESAIVPELDMTISKASAAIKQAQDELEANPKFQELKEQLKDVTSAMKDVKKFQTAIIHFALHLIEEKGR